jgi:DNA modification methylase
MPDEDREIANKRQKPAGLLTYMFNGFTKQGDLILDPFAGSGQTLMVCEALGRKCITVEIIPEMVRAIINRFENKFGIKAIKINKLQVKK